jgi:hypothetical protein
MMQLHTMTLTTCSISSKREASCLWRPDVSTIMISFPMSLNFFTPTE